MPFEFIRWKLAESFGWTLDYIDSLSMSDVEQWMQILDGKSKAAKTKSKLGKAMK